VCQRWELLSQRINSAVSAQTSAVNLDKSLESLSVCLNDIYVQLTHLRHFSDDMSVDSKLACLSVGIVMNSTQILYSSAEVYAVMYISWFSEIVYLQ